MRWHFLRRRTIKSHVGPKMIVVSFVSRQVALDSLEVPQNGSAGFSPGSEVAGGCGAPADHNRGTKANGRPPMCLVCARADSRQYLVECENFIKPFPWERRQTEITTGRCLNCLSTDHLARSHPSRCKFRKCDASYRAKHFSVIHDSYKSNHWWIQGR